MIWLFTCVGCGLRLEGEEPPRGCPQCGGTSWLARFSSLPEAQTGVSQDYQEAMPSPSRDQAEFPRRGRPRKAIDEGAILALHPGKSVREIAAIMQVSKSTVQRVLHGKRESG